MKKLMIIISAALALTFISGCDKLPSADKIEKLSMSIGYTAGFACQIGNIRDNDREAILTVMDIVDDVVPNVDKTFEETWNPIINETIQKLVDEGKIDVIGADLVKIAMSAVVKGLDYIFYVRYPKAKEYKELVSAAIHGFTEGFKTVIVPSNTRDVPELDKEAYEYFKANFKK